MILQGVLILAFLAVAGYGVWEVRRWQTPAGRVSVSPRQRRLRRLGLFFLLLTLGLWLGGTSIPVPGHGPETRTERESALRFIGYWTVTALAALPLIPLALLDSRENLRRLAEERRQLLRETLGSDPTQCVLNPPGRLPRRSGPFLSEQNDFLQKRTDDEQMGRALRLAVLARHASPNPSVGCVLVGPDSVTVGEGWTQPVGQAHAEVMALRHAGDSARGATAYVTLEPCSHYGRTPPCANALVRAGIARVVVAMTDPDFRVSGRGLRILRDAGLVVESGLRETEARALNAAFIKHRTTGVPWVVLKTAMTLDGKIATRLGSSQWITSAVARRAVHRQLRDRCDAILTGVGTVLADNPSLKTRLVHMAGRDPLRVIVDSHCRTPSDAQVVQNAEADGRTLIATTAYADKDNQERLQRRGCQVLICESDALGRVALPDLLTRLGTRGDTIGVLVESGGELAASLLEQRLIDRWLNFIAPKVVGGQTSPGPIGGLGIARMDEALFVNSWRLRRCGPDFVIDARFG